MKGFLQILPDAASMVLSEKGFPRVREASRLLFIDTLINLPEVTSVNARPSKTRGERINLLIPSIDPVHYTSGGLATALKFFKRLVSEFPLSRILLTDFEPSPEAVSEYKDYSFRSIHEDTNDSKQVVSVVDKSSGALPVGEGDVFIATIWWSEIIARGLTRWQAKHLAIKEKPVIYFIQDYEPLFYPSSGRSLLATETYQREGPTIAVINTELLKEYLHLQGQRFAKEFSFNPRMNQTLHEYFVKYQKTRPRKEKRILVYGRPYSRRNAMDLIVESLRIWATQYKNARNWEVVSAGERHLDIKLSRALRIKSLGPLPLEDYAELLSHSSVGMSFMVSPHPSYPPLEMSHFGLNVITNKFSIKDIAGWHDNIHTVSDNAPSQVANKLGELCEAAERDPQIGWSGRSHIPWYLEKRDEFEFINDLIAELNKYRVVRRM